MCFFPHVHFPLFLSLFYQVTSQLIGHLYKKAIDETNVWINVLGSPYRLIFVLALWLALQRI